MSRRRPHGSGKRNRRGSPAASRESLGPETPTPSPHEADDSRPRPGRFAAFSHPSGLISQVFASTALSAFGSTAALLVCVHELTFHATTVGHALASAGMAVCAGVVLGLWLLRRALARRLEQRADASIGSVEGDPAAAAESPPMTFDFAATLTGGLLLTLGVSWLAICTGAAAMESYRAWLTSQIGIPAWLYQFALHTPLLIGLMWAGLVGAVALLALHGWQRLLVSSSPALVELWLVITLAAGMATLAAIGIYGQRVVMVVALATLFMGGSLAVWRRRGGNFARHRPSTRLATRLDLPQLILVATASAAVGIALLATVAPQTRLLRTIATRAALFPGIVLVSIAVAWMARRWLGRAGVPAILILAIAVIWPLPLHLALGQTVAPHVRLACVAGCATICALSVTRGLSAGRDSTLLLISSVGTAIAAGLLLGLPVGVCCLQDTSHPARGPLISVALTAVAGLYLVLDRQPRRRTRVVGLLAVASWLALLPLVGSHPQAEQSRARKEAVAAGIGSSAMQPLPHGRGSGQTPAPRRWLLPRAGVTLDTRPPGTAIGRADNAWLADLHHSGLSAALLLDSASPPALRSREATLRLIRRATHTLALNGHLIVELPQQDPHRQAARLARRARAVTKLPARYLRIWHGDECYHALVFGNNIPAWLASHPIPEDATIDLHNFSE